MWASRKGLGGEAAVAAPTGAGRFSDAVEPFGAATSSARFAGTQGESPKAREGGLGHSPQGEGFGAVP